MNTAYIVITLILTSGSSILFGYFALPHIVDYIIIKTRFNSFRAMYIAKRARRKKRKEFERSDAYTKRLSEVLNFIRDASVTQERSVKISYLADCETENEINRELQRRGFETWHDETNTLKISW